MPAVWEGIGWLPTGVVVASGSCSDSRGSRRRSVRHGRGGFEAGTCVVQNSHEPEGSVLSVQILSLEFGQIHSGGFKKSREATIAAAKE